MKKAGLFIFLGLVQIAMAVAAVEFGHYAFATWLGLYGLYCAIRGLFIEYVQRP